MWLSSVLLLLVALSSTVADEAEVAMEEGIEKCLRSAEFDQKHLVTYPDEDDLEAICPYIIGAFDCLRDVVEDYAGHTLELMFEIGDDEDVEGLITVFLNTEALLRDLCNEDTQIHKDYLASEKCYDKALGPENMQHCGMQARAAYNTYKDFEDSIQEEAGENTIADKRECLLAAYFVACTGATVKEECGQKAFDTYVEIVKRTTMLKNGVCSGNQLEIAKNEFIDRLELESTHKDLYSLALDYMKRKK